MPSNVNLDVALHFLDQLRQNNKKVWFDAHRSDYENARSQFEQLVNTLIDEFRSSDHLQGLTAKDCVARIYRDIRFSKDKSPYKTNLSAEIAPGGWKSTALGYYISLEPHGQSMVAGGWYEADPEQLNRFRQAIDTDAAQFKSITHARDFLEAFGPVEGERLKTAPKGYDRAHPEIELLQLKQIIAIHRFSDADVVAPDFPARVERMCRTMRPFLDYLTQLTH